jgi:hypothetical protein
MARGRPLAVATIGRDQVLLEEERAMELRGVATS